MNEMTCSYCKNDVTDDSDYCPRCGSLFAENVNCSVHNNIDAEGVCVICSEPFCDQCGSFAQKVFLCNKHKSFEIYEGMARIFGSPDTVQSEFVKSCLEQNGIHPLIFSRKSSPMHLGGSDYSLFRPSGDYDGHLINEIKVLVPCTEVSDAEKIIAELDL